MERKLVNAVLVNEFEEFLKEKDLYQNYCTGKLVCAKCGKAITHENIAYIYYSDGYKFCCNNKDCLGV